MSSDRRRARPPLSLSLVATIAAVTAATLLAGRPHLGGDTWSRGDDVALLGAWAVAVAASAWLAVVTGACVVALGSGRTHIARRFVPALPFGLRRLVETAIVASTIASGVALPALPASAAAPPSFAVVLADEPVVRAPVPAPASAPTAAPAPPPAPPPRAPRPAGGERVVVRAGDNLWLIARTSLTRVAARRPTDAEVMRHWLVVIAANRSTLRSGDPSVVFPGEIVTVPPAPALS